MDSLINDSNYLSVEKWVADLVAQNNYLKVECLCELRHGGSLSISLIAKTTDDATLFLDVTSPVQNCIESLMSPKIKKTADVRSCFFNLIVDEQGKAIKSELYTDVEKSQTAAKEYKKQIEESYSSELFEKELVELLIKSIQQYGEIKRTFNPRDSLDYAIWTEDKKAFHVGEIFQDQYSPVFSFSSSKEFGDWLLKQSPKSLYKQGVFWKKGEIVEAMKMAPYYAKTTK